MTKYHVNGQISNSLGIGNIANYFTCTSSSEIGHLLSSGDGSSGALSFTSRRTTSTSVATTFGGPSKHTNHFRHRHSFMRHQK